MKILIHSNAPWVPSGYGQQVRQLLPRLKAMGHEPAVSAFYGLSGAAIHWNGTPCFPAGQRSYGVDMLLGHAQMYEADLILTLMDLYQLAPIAGPLREYNVAAWLPVDCSPLGFPDTDMLGRSKIRPIAMSRFGHQQLTDASWHDALYVPHAVDTKIFKPLTMSERTARREEAGVNDLFVIGINSANRDSLRKGWAEQFQAFKLLNTKYPDTRLWVHSVPDSINGLHLEQLAQDMGIQEHVQFTETYAQMAGLLSPELLAQWYSICDVVSVCSYGEGFGVPIIEAQACGTPVISTDASAMTELNPYGWKVAGEQFWNPVHRAFWKRPSVAAILDAYEQAYLLQERGPLSRRVRQFAADMYDTHEVAVRYWSPALADLSASIKPREINGARVLEQ